ncbi:MAG: preprotein translocase subunit SecA [Patescibacteria group bacterium]|jgi:preprotein translocase subunit SecA|nr:preprotein translocase subunit SecA [Patescibacteria group bacterium]
MSFLNKIFGDPKEKYIKSIEPLVLEINDIEKDLKDISDEDLQKKSKDLQEGVKKGESLDDVMFEGFALVRETAKRTLGQRHYNSQIMGGIALHQGKIAEMKTGEGKTLSATLAVYLNAVTKKGVHVITVNEYLARRDTVWMGQIYHYLGLSIGCINDRQSFLYDPYYKSGDEEKDSVRDTLGSFYVEEDFLLPCTRKEAYQADITYGTNNQFGFDYLRDNMATSIENKAQRGFSYAVIDEVDSILIDEARTPLIISVPEEQEEFESKKEMYKEFSSRIVPKLETGSDYEVHEKEKAVTLTEEGIEKVEKILGVENIYDEKGMDSVYYLEQTLRAQAKHPGTKKPLYEKDINYVIKDGEVIIVDEFTGRLMPGRRWSGGLHQAIEAKEGVQIRPESQTMASVTFQNLFKMYEKISGMTGTATSSEEELFKVYGTEVAVIPTHKDLIRIPSPDVVYKTEQVKLDAVVEEVKKRNEKGQPVLIGTASIEKNEILSVMLKRQGVKHKVLNAKNHEKEAEMIAQAGKWGAVTVATNMAGRGVDIVLGGNPPDEEEARKVKEVGGLFVLGTERHEARRIDDQLRGRCGRQGDPGESQFFVSLEDSLLRIFGGEKVQAMMERFSLPDDEPIRIGYITKIIQSAQKRVEGHHFDARKQIMQYDDVLFKHRKKFYELRNEILERAEVKDEDSEKNLRSYILEVLKRQEKDKKEYLEKESEIGKEEMRKVQRFVCLRTMDFLWKDHLTMMDELREAVRLRAYGQKEPLIEYKREGHIAFNNMMKNIESMIADRITKIKKAEKIRNNSRIIIRNNIDPEKEKLKSFNRAKRNDPCPCGATHPDGSPVKFKKCHGK